MHITNSNSIYQKYLYFLAIKKNENSERNQGSCVCGPNEGRENDTIEQKKMHIQKINA